MGKKESCSRGEGKGGEHQIDARCVSGNLSEKKGLTPEEKNRGG